jgi:hypothetical protein
MRLALILAAIGTMSAQGVPTWGGLRFGMTEAQVRSVLGAKMVKVGPGPENQPIDELSHDFIAGEVRELSVKGFEGRASLLFDKSSKRLSVVTLLLEPLKSISDQAKINAYSQFSDDLVKKYGPPVSVKEFSRIFRSGGQSIDVSAYTRDDGLRRSPELTHRCSPKVTQAF